MEKSLISVEVCRLIEEELGIDRSRIRPCFDQSRSRVSCLVHDGWLQRYICGLSSYEESGKVSPWSPYEHQLILQPSHPEPAVPWNRISIYVIKKPVRRELLRKSFPQALGSGVDNEGKCTVLSYAELVQCVGVHNLRHSWESSLDSYPLAAQCVQPTQAKKESDKNVVDEMLLQAYGLCSRKLFPDTESVEQSNFSSTAERDAFDDFKEESEGSSLSLTMRQNVVPFICALEGQSAYFLIEPYFQHSLHNMVTFSPSVLSGSNTRPLFMIYELLHALHWYHSHGIAHGALNLHGIKVNKGLWIYLESPDFFHGCQPDFDASEVDGVAGDNVSTARQSDVSRSMILNYTADDLPRLVELWVHGKISNYDYLMALNFLVGRRLGDPNYHPVFPWVTDFSVRDGGYRDLKKSKFRLNKGDRQLDVTYKAALLDNSQDGAPPHHVSDVLSDITYHVYLARRTPKSVLCDHVRTNWVPNEYPPSMERLYHWTPDECIPQFFSDANIFESVHEDLSDLELPSWTSSAEEFIWWHRSVLESDTVSANLHHWIDLTFGFKLAGRAAVKAKNVYLHLIDKHQTLSNHGVVQLFTEPHPERAQPCFPHTNTLFLGRRDHEILDGRIIRNFTHSDLDIMADKSSALEESVMSVDSSTESDFILGHQPRVSTEGKEHNSKLVLTQVKESINEDDVPKGAQFEPIPVPTNYNPLEMLERFEALENFKNQFGPRGETSLGNHEIKSDVSANFSKLVQADMVSLGCAIVEMLLPSKVQLATCGLTGKLRKEAIIQLCQSNDKLLPRYARAAVHALLTEGDKDSHDALLPRLTADLLLQPHLGLFPFPSYFSALHDFLAAFYHTGRKIEPSTYKSKLQDSLVFLRGEAGYTVEQVDIAASFLPDLLSIVDDEGIKLLLYHLEPLFTCLETRLHACTQLFDMLAQALGPKNSIKSFLKCLVSLFDSHALDVYEVIAKQTFLSQIIVRFGLDGFLKHVISFVVDAVSFNSKMESKADKIDRISVHSSEDATSGIVCTEMEYSAKGVPLDIDDLDLPGDFLREGSEDQDVPIGSFSMGIEEFETEGKFAITHQNLGQARGGEGKDEVEQVTLLPRGIIDDEVDARLFQGHISDDEDNAGDDEPTNRGHVSKIVSIERICDFSDCTVLDSGAMEVEDRSLTTATDADQVSACGDDNTKGRELEGVIANACEASEREKNFKPLDSLKVDVKKNVDEAQVQKSEASNTNCVEVPEELTGESGIATGTDNRTVPYITTQFSSSDKGDNVTEERNEGCTLGSPLDGVTDEKNRELQETERTDNGNKTADDILENLSFPEGDPASEEEDAASSEDDSRDNEVDPEDNVTNKSKQSTYEINTFYNDTNYPSKPVQYGKKVLKQHDELTPGTISTIAAESIVWLAPRLGPVLTSKYIASQLLTMLPHCYIGYVGTNDDDDDLKTVSDSNAKWVLFCLSNFCTLYGEAFLLNQYLPYINKTIRGVQTKVTQRGEAALAGVLSLLKYCIPYLSRDTLASNTESQLMTGIFQPVIRILSSYTLTFPGGFSARQAICRSYIDVLTVVCLKLEREFARDYMTAPLQQFFSCFELERMRTIKMNEKKEGSSPLTYEISFNDALELERAPEEKEEKHISAVLENVDGKPTEGYLYNSPVYEELCQTFNPAIAHHAFVPLCGIMGSKYMETSLHNHDLIWNLCCSYDAQLSHPTCEDNRASEDEEDEEENENHRVNIGTSELDSETVDGSRGVDNSPEEQSQDKKESKKREKVKKIPKPPMWFIGKRLAKTKDVPTSLPSSSSSDQYLRGSWLTQWENQLSLKGKEGNKFNLQQVKLQTFTGHNGPARSVYVQDSEHCFLSASKDKTVKLWSLSNHGDGTAQSASSWTYARHTRPVFHVNMVESVRQGVSCDGSLHLWDAVSDRCLWVYDYPRNNPIVAITTLPAPSKCVVAAMAEGTARMASLVKTSGLLGFLLESKPGHCVIVLGHNTMRFLDVRQHKFVTEWKITTSSVPGTVRDVCCSPDGRWIAFGFSTGLASVLDIRGGLLRSQRRAHTGDIFQVKAFSSSSFITSSVDSGLSLWKDDGFRLKTLKGPSDPLPSLLVWGDQLISATVGGRIGVHSLQEDHSEDPYISYKLSSDVFRGNITCLGYLPLNRLLLIGNDTGNIVLCS